MHHFHTADVFYNAIYDVITAKAIYHNLTGKIGLICANDSKISIPGNTDKCASSLIGMGIYIYS